MADDHDFFAMKARHTANNGRVIGKSAVAVNLGPISENPFNVIESVGALRMAGQFGFLPRYRTGRDLRT